MEREIMGDKILIVDGVQSERTALSQMLQETYGILEADNGESAVKLIEEHINELSVILLKLMIPKLNGIRVLEILNEKKWSGKVPVLVIDGAGASGMEDKCLDLGTMGFLGLPLEQKAVTRQVKNAIRVFQRHALLEQKLEQQAKTMKRQYQLLQKQTEELNRSRTEIIDILGTVVEFSNVGNNDHIKRVKAFTEILAEEMKHMFPDCGLTDLKVQMIASASALHDIGKIAIPDEILQKPTKVSEQEYEYLKSHTTKGCEILESIRDTWDKDYADTCYDICRYHHERYDGQGYPDGLTGEDIPLSAQLVSLADVYDALVSERVYKKAYSKERAYQMIVSGECGVFAPRLMNCFRNVREKLEELVPDDLEVMEEDTPDE